VNLSCPTCGAAVSGETADELIEKIERHIEQEHPELIGRLVDDDFLDLVGEGSS
jgi:predicted small metal-binding protein